MDMEKIGRNRRTKNEIRIKRFEERMSRYDVVRIEYRTQGFLFLIPKNWR